MHAPVPRGVAALTAAGIYDNRARGLAGCRVYADLAALQSKCSVHRMQRGIECPTDGSLSGIQRDCKRFRLLRMKDRRDCSERRRQYGDKKKPGSGPLHHAEETAV